MRTTEAVEEARRVMTVCNACRYCEGFCAVFPAMELRRVFSNADLSYLANLCHGCRDCCYACPYTPPHEVGILEGAKFRNIEQQAIAFITKTMLPWFVLWEQRVGHDLIIPSAALPGDFFFEFNLAGLLRGDLKSRYEAYHIGRQGGWLSVNEIRKLENMNPIEGGDAFLEPLNMTPVGADPKPDPDDDDDKDDDDREATVTEIRRQA